MNTDQRRVLIQILLFLVTCITTTMAGAEWTYGRSVFMPDYSWSDFISGLQFSVPFLLILTVHEFGHYFVAKYHRVRATLPYYIPIPPIPFSIGTMGAVIRLKSKIYSKKQNFDIGIAGPLAGFVMALAVLFYGFTNLPPASYIFQIHPEYEEYGFNYAASVYENQPENVIDITIGQNLLFLFFEQFVADPDRMPNPHEIMHYPFLFAGYLSLVFTCLNLLPIGQLDGGHVVYGLFGFKTHRIIATIFFVALIFYAGLGVVDPRDHSNILIFETSVPYLAVAVPGFIAFLYFALRGLGLSKPDTLMYALLIFAAQVVLTWLLPGMQGFSGWLIFVFILGRFVGVQHPPSEIEEPLDTKRIFLGWLCLLIFIVCLSPQPIVMN